jgi:Stress-induced bacterial acidophilic repeat motif
MKGANLCSLHADPKRAAEIGRKGGKRNLKLYDGGPQTVSIPESPADVKRMLAETMAEVRAGRMDPRQGTVLAYISHSLLKAMELSEEKKPPVYPDIYRGLSEVKRTVRPEEMQQNVVHPGLAAQEQGAQPLPRYVQVGGAGRGGDCAGSVSLLAGQSLM